MLNAYFVVNWVYFLLDSFHLKNKHYETFLVIYATFLCKKRSTEVLSLEDTQSKVDKDVKAEKRKKGKKVKLDIPDDVPKSHKRKIIG
jgi:hypothetical protein